MLKYERARSFLKVLAGLLVSSLPCAGASSGAKTSNSTAAAPATPFAAVTVCDTDLTLDSPDKPPKHVSLDTILDHYERGEWGALQWELAFVAAKARHKCTAERIPPTARVSFAIVDDHVPQPTVVRILQGHSPAPSLASQRLLDSGALFTIYLYGSGSNPVFTAYSASAVPSPVEAGFAQVVSTGVGGLKSVPPAAGGAPQKLAELETGVPVWPTVRCVVAKATIPKDLKWAQLTLTDTVDVQPLLTAASVAARVNDKLGPPTPSDADPIRVLAASLSRAFAQGGPCCSFALDIPAAKETALPDCQSILRGILYDSLQKLRDAGLDPVALNKARDAAMAIYSMYSGILTSTRAVSVQTVYSYGPLTHWAFGLGAGVVLTHDLNDQVKISSDVLVGDPGSGTLTSVNVYYSPFGYDESTLKAAAQELPRAVGGLVLTPNPGAFLGLGVALPFLRSVTVDGGYAVMLGPVAPHGAKIGDTATSTKRGVLGGWILELGYSF